MAVSTTDTFSGPLLANGVTTAFPFTFKALTGAEVAVESDVAGVRSTVNPLTYTVTLTSNGGTVTFATAPASGQSIYIISNPDFRQNVQFADQERFGADAVNEVNDRGAIRDLVLKGKVDRAIKVPVGESPVDLPAVAARAGKFLVFDGSGNPAVASGTGTDANLRTDLANVAVGGRLAARRRAATWETRDVDAALNDLPVSVFENFTPAQIAAVRAGSPITFLADAINEMLSDVSVSGGGRVFLPIGAYDLRATVLLPPLVEFEGEGLGLLAGYDPGLVRGSGTVLAKNHNGHCITVTGAAANSLSAGIRNIIISSNRTTYPTGSGIVVDKVGGYRISEVKIFGVGEDGLVLGVTAGDVTTQIHLNGIYINNPGAVCIRNRSKWLKALQVETDGGTHGLFNLDAPNIDFTQFHFEGASQKAVVLAGANGNSRFAGGYIGLTNLASTKGIELASAAGNTDIEFDHVHIVGHAGITAGIEIGAAAWRTAARNCTLGSLPVGVLTVASDTEISSTAFVGCALPIDQQGNYPRFFGNRFEATTGNWAIDQKAGSGGIISGNVTDKPFRPATTAITFTAALTAAISGTLNANWAGATGPYTITFSDGSIRTATLTNGSAAVTWTGAVTATANATAANKIGDFGTNIVKDNPGFKTAARGKTAAIASGTVIPHGMSVTPHTAFLRSPSASLPADFAYTWDGTNITPTWTGGLSFVLVWEAFAVCENP